MVHLRSDPESDREFAARLAAGDPAAFDEMFRMFLSPLCRYIDRYVRAWDVAEDLAQAVFFQLWIRVRERELPPIRNVQAYLYNAARGDALDYLRRQRVAERNRYVHLAPDSEAHAQIQLADWDEETASRERLAALQRAVDHLPPRQRAVLLLRLKKMSYEEIAATLHVSKNTVDAHLQRALARLRSTVKQLVG